MAGPPSLNIPVDSYEVIEKSVPDPYVVGDEPTQTIYLAPGEDRELIFDNLKQPLLTIAQGGRRRLHHPHPRHHLYY